MTDYQPADFNKTYQINVQVDDVPANEIVDLGWAGTYPNAGTYDVDPERITRFEMGCRVPFYILELPASCTLVVTG